MSDILNRYLEKSLKINNLYSLQIIITENCNLYCDHCFKVHSHNFIEVVLFKNAIDQATEAGAIKIGFNGGEPLLHPNFQELAAYVLGKGLTLSINSNGTLFTPKLFDFFKKWKGVLFQISLYGHDATSSKKITGDATAFAKTIQTIKTMKKLGFTFKVALLARQDEQAYLASLYDNLSSQGIITRFQPHICAREDGNQTALNLNIRNKKELKKVLALDPIPDKEEFPLTTQDNTPMKACGSGVGNLGLDVNGNIKPCDLHPLVLGNLKDHTLQEIYNSPQLHSFRQGNLLPEKCCNCQYLEFCARCPVVDSFETGDTMKISTRNCQIARLRKELSDKLNKQDT